MSSLGRLLDATPELGRTPGSNQPIAMLVRDMFVEAGVTDVVIEEFAIPVSAATSHSFELKEPAALAGPREHTVNVFGGDGTVQSVEVIDIGMASAPNPAAAGKVAMFDFAVSRSLRTQYRNVVESGAVGAIIDSRLDALRQRGVWTLSGADSIDGPIPVVTIEQSHAAAMREELMRGGSVRIDLSTNAGVTPMTGYNVVAKIPGTMYPDRKLIITAHHDSWFAGAADDGQAVGALIAIAKVVAAKPLPYTLELVSFDCEETMLLGSNNYVRRRLPALRDEAVGAISLEMLAPKNPILRVITIDPKGDTWLAAAQDSGLTTIFNAVLTPVDQMVGFAGEIPSDQGNFWQFGIPGFYVVQTYPEYHSVLDNAENTDEASFEETLGALERTLRELGKAPPEALAVAPENSLDVVPTVTNRTPTQLTGTLTAVNAATREAADDAVVTITVLNNDYNLVVASGVGTFVPGTGFTFTIDYAFEAGTPYVLSFDVQRPNRHTGRALLQLE